MRFSKYARRGQLEVGGDWRSDGPPTGEAPGWVCDTDPRHFEGTAVEAVWYA